MRDCVFLLADSHMRAVLSTFLTHPKRDEKLGTGPFHFDADRDLLLAENDGNVLRHAHHRLRDYQTSYNHAIIVLDFAFEHQLKPERIVDQIQCNMVQKGWSATRFEVVLIQPELEAWIWQEDSPLMQDVFYRWLSKTERDALPPLRLIDPLIYQTIPKSCRLQECSARS